MLTPVRRARTGHLNHHLSAFQKFTGFTFEILFEERQRSIGIIVN